MPTVDEVFKALGDPTRVRIAEMLARRGEMCVCRIMEELDMTQPAVSHHLATLKHAGLVSCRRQGQWIHYSLRRSTVSKVAHDFIQGLLEEAAPAALDQCRC